MIYVKNQIFPAENSTGNDTYENNRSKTQAIPCAKLNNIYPVSRSWNDYSYGTKTKKKYSISPTYLNNYKPYDPINNCKSAGIIPYTIHNNVLYFLLQQIQTPIKKKILAGMILVEKKCFLQKQQQK